MSIIMISRDFTTFNPFLFHISALLRTKAEDPGRFVVKITVLPRKRSLGSGGSGKRHPGICLLMPDNRHDNSEKHSGKRYKNVSHEWEEI